MPSDAYKLENLTKQQLLLAKQYFLDLKQIEESDEHSKYIGGPTLIKNDKNGKR